MKQFVYGVISIVGCLLVAGVVVVFLKQPHIVFNNQLNGSTQVRTAPSQEASDAPRSTGSVILDEYRRAGSAVPLKDTLVWQQISSDIATSQRHKNYKQARIVSILTPLLEYEVELLDTKAHKILNITPNTMLMVPRYVYDSYNNIVDADYVSVQKREAISSLEENALILFYVKDPDVLEGSNLSHFEANWLVFAD